MVASPLSGVTAEILNGVFAMLRPRRWWGQLLSQLFTCEFLHATSGCRLARVHVSSGVDRQIVQCGGELAGPGAALAERPDDAEFIAAKNPYLLIRAIGNVEECLIRREIDVRHRSASRRLRNEDLPLEAAVLPKDLESAVAPVAHIDEAVSIDSQAVHGIPKLPWSGSGGIGFRGRGGIIRLLTVCAPVPFVGASLRVEHNHPMVPVRFTVRDIELVAARIHAHLRRLAHVCRDVTSPTLPGTADLRQELSCAGEREDVRVPFAVAADPDAVPRVDGNAMDLLRPLVAFSRASPRLDDV